MSDVRNVDLGALVKWQQDVNTELIEVDKTLDKVARVSKECEGDDSIYGCFKKLGDGIANAYLELSKVYRDTMEATGGIIDSMKKGAESIIEGIQNFANNFHR